MTIADPEIQAPAAAPPADPGPLPKRVMETFISPGELFSRFGPNAPWLGVLVIGAVLVAASFALTPTSVFVDMMREQMANAPRQPGQPQPDPETMAMFGRIFGLISALAYPLIGAVVVGGLLKLIFGAMMGGEATFQQYLAVYAHAFLVVALGALVTLPIIIASGDMMRQLNLALLMPDLSRSGFAFRFLSQFGVFPIWQYALIAIGVGAVNRGRVSTAAAWGGVFGFFLLTAALAGLPALLQRG